MGPVGVKDSEVERAMPNLKVAIASGKGGTGKTLISTNLFHVLQVYDYNATLVDCDAEEPNDMIFFNRNLKKSIKIGHQVPVIDTDKCVFCGKCHEYCSYNAIFIIPHAGIIKVIEDQCHSCGACIVACENGAIKEKEIELGEVHVYTSPGKIIESAMRPGIASPVKVIKTAVTEAGLHGIIILDSPPGTSCPFIHTVMNADHVILVTEPTPFGLSDLKQSVETLKTMNKSCSVILNRVGIGNNEVYKYLEEENIPIVMEIPFDKVIAGYYTNGELVVNHLPEMRDKFLVMIKSIIEKYGNSNY